MEPLKHECGIAMMRLLKPISYYEQKYGTSLYGLNKLYLMMEKERNRGQEGAGLACLRLEAEPGEEYMFRERGMGGGAIQEIFAEAQRKRYVGEIYMGHLRYSTTGKRGIQYVHPFLRRNNWRAKNLCFCANFNMTNVDEILHAIAVEGQHPRMVSDTYILLEQLGHRLDRESERCFVEAQQQGLTGCDITHYIEDHINLANVLRLSAPLWDGGYAICGMTGSGETFVMRDPWGIRPCFWYLDEEALAVASERPVIQTALDVEAHDVHELLPGQALLMNRHGELRLEQILEPQRLAACSFERVYFSRGSDGDIYNERKQMGRQLVPAILSAINNEVDNTVFSYIPNTAEAAYYGLLQGLQSHLNTEKVLEIQRLQRECEDAGTPLPSERLRSILERSIRAEKVAWKDIKMRTFIAEGTARKDLAAHVYDITYGSLRPGEDNLVIIDDSIVRGTTLKESIIRILDRLHPRRIVIVSSSPQVRYPDYYGIDMSRMDEFIAFRAAVSLILRRSGQEAIRRIYELCKSQENKPKEEITNHVRKIYEPFTAEELNEEMVRLLRPEGVSTEIHFVYQTLEGHRQACPTSPGDWYFSGHYPTPGGNLRLNQAFINWYEGYTW